MASILRPRQWLFWPTLRSLGTFYNGNMRINPSIALAAALTCGLGQAWAQTPAQPPSASLPASSLADRQSTQLSGSNQLIERIHVETRHATIEEVRYGGETRSIAVAPKGGFPAYNVQPATGERTWKILGF